jgi:large subunit ribosomal protein L4
MDAIVYNKEGKEAGKIKLPKDLFDVPMNADLVHQIVVSMQSNERVGLASVKGRGDVRGGGKKPWRQKGTGRARHGSRRSPLWIGGGITHGPNPERNFTKKINKKMAAKALATVLSQKLRDGEVVFVDAFSVSEPKTKDAEMFIHGLSQGAELPKLMYKKKPRACLVAPTWGDETLLSLRNLPGINVKTASSVSILDLLRAPYSIIITPSETIETLEKRASISS